MKHSQKTKSRTKLYNAISGANELTGPAGVSAVGDIVFTDIPLAGEQVVIGDYYFEAQAGATEAPGTSTGASDDPHLFQAITDLATAGASLAACVLAETETTGRWGYLYPDDDVGCDFTTDTLTLTFWPGTWANGIAFSGTGDITSTTTATGGVDSKMISSEYNWNIIDTTGSSQNKEYYVIPDGDYIGETCKVMVKTFDTGDTPTLLGKLSKLGTDYVEALIATAEPGKSVEFIWTGSVWELVNELDVGTDYTALAFTASS